MSKTLSADPKVNSYYQAVYNTLIPTYKQHQITVFDVAQKFNEKFETDYVLYLKSDSMRECLYILSNESAEMDDLFVRIIRQGTSPLIEIKIYKEV